jgi:hypothetical protein
MNEKGAVGCRRHCSSILLEDYSMTQIPPHMLFSSRTDDIPEQFINVLKLQTPNLQE